MRTNETELLIEMFEAAVSAAQPASVIPKYLPAPPVGRTVVIGAGKASAEMARAFEASWTGPSDRLSGLVVTRYDYAVDCKYIEIVEAAHPVPDQAGTLAAQRILDTVSSLTEYDLVVCLISGGGSALLSLPSDRLTLDDKQQINRSLLKVGANIKEMNCVRKHLSAIKGGRLAAACNPARLVTLMISDVPDDDPDVIASGPTVPDPTTYADALAILKKYRITSPDTAISHIQKGVDETPKPGDPRLANTEAVVIAAPQMSLEAAAAVARKHGITPVILGDSIEGESRDVALVHAGIAKQVIRHGQPVVKPCVLLSGGETTVTLKGRGRGGRNAEFSLALAIALNGLPGVFALAADTDGIDGSEDNAGALVTPETLQYAAAKGANAGSCLDENNAYGFFQQIEHLFVTGPTLTNVNDFRAILIT
ncbi:hydroxypyruvate reductase [Chromatiales bacterium (ex Bugula neritina AB1)]|nr:hydroxypyruvate reductase [Chromatiales bacterium (ex Bugula neritina AB1)]